MLRVLGWEQNLGKVFPAFHCRVFVASQPDAKGAAVKIADFFLVIYIPGFEMFRHCQTKREALWSAFLSLSPL